MRPTAKNPPQRFESTFLDYDDGMAGEVSVTVVDDASRTILASNDSPDVGFTYSVNPYRGCFHGCSYCFARPFHEYLGYGAGTDFDRVIVVKREAPTLLRDAFEKRTWKGDLVVFSGVTDCYQPLERDLELTRGCLETCALYKNPVGIITKSVLVERDIDVLTDLTKNASARVTVSLPFLDAEVARALEPYVPTPERRLRTIETLAKAGIQVGISVSPLVPGLGEDALGELLSRAKDAGASHTFAVMLRLPGAVKEVFLGQLRDKLPLRAEKVIARLQEMHGKSLYNARFLVRQSGEGVYAMALRAMYESAADKVGLPRLVEAGATALGARASTFERPLPRSTKTQLSLFDAPTKS